MNGRERAAELLSMWPKGCPAPSGYADWFEWARAQARLGERAELFRPGKGGRATYLLSGLVRCGVCGGAFVVGAHRPVRYACSTRRHAGDAACSNHLMVERGLAEGRILERLQRELLTPEAVREGVRRMRELARQEAETPAPELARVDAQIAELERLRREGVLSPEIAGAALARAHRERDAARRATASVTDALIGAEEAYVETVAELWTAIGGDDVPAAREALREFLGPIRLHPAGDHLVAEMTAGRLPLALNWNGSGGSIWCELRRAG